MIIDPNSEEDYFLIRNWGSTINTPTYPPASREGKCGNWSDNVRVRSMFKFLYDIKNRNFLRLWIAQLISQFGDRVHQMALVGLIAERSPGSVTDLAKLLAATIIPVFIVGPIAGVYVDRWDRRITMFFSDLIRGLLVLSIPMIWMLQSSMVPIYIVVFLSFCLSRFHVPAKMSLLPSLIQHNNLVKANSWISMTGMLAFVLGIAGGGYIVERYGAQGGFLWDAMTFFFSGAIIFSMSIPRLSLSHLDLLPQGRRIIGEIKKSILGEMKEGIRYLISQKELRLILNMLFLVFAAAGAIYVVIIIFIQQTFQSVTRDLSILAILLGAGLLLGSIIYGKWGQRVHWVKTIFLCLFLGGLVLSSFAVLVYSRPNMLLAGSLALGLGIMMGPIFIVANTVAHKVSVQSMQGKVFTAIEIVTHFAFLISMLGSSIVSRHVAQVWILAFIGGIFTLVGLWGWLKYKRHPDLAFSIS